ncbi:hypothetical protein [Atopobacter phocae]|uniref:hypothetical protein n=1 Tax=Atopobacter phocae TaxID=136492 RepID=UPI0004722581|nr:hypothetical protein [Atopobacter phocae]
MEQLQLSHVHYNESLEELILPIEQVIKDLKQAFQFQLPTHLICDFKDQDGFVYQAKIRARILHLDMSKETVIVEDLDTRVQYFFNIEEILSTDLYIKPTFV